MKRSHALMIVMASIPMMTAADGQAVRYETSAQGKAALEEALLQQQRAARNSLILESEAKAAVKAAEKTAREAAALASRVQEAEAGMAAAEARLAIVRVQQDSLNRRLAEKQQPLLKLTASLQNLSRRPVSLSLLQPGGVRDMIHLRAMLDAAVPEVQRRTAGLRAELAEGRELGRQAELAASGLRAERLSLEQRRASLSALETRQDIASRQKSGEAAREAERALALAEQARDLSGLVTQLDKTATLRQQLAGLPGPVLRPARPSESQVEAEGPSVKAEPSPGLGRYVLPVSGRTVTGFGVPLESGELSRGILLAPRPAAQVVAPASGRVAFAGPYRGYGEIVILEHDGGWTSLVTGLARADVTVGETLLSGSPLGVAGTTSGEVGLELRRNGTPVNPLEFLR